MRLASTSSRVRSSGARCSMSWSNVRLASSIIAHSSPRISTPWAAKRLGSISLGSLPSVSRPSALASRRAGAIVTTATRRPRSAMPIATAAAVVVLPTPPGPAQITIRRPASRGSTDVSTRTSECAAGQELDEALAHRERDRLGAAAGIQLGHHVVQDVLDGALRVAELLGDLAGRVAFGNQREHLLLAVGQPRRERARVAAVAIDGRQEAAEQVAREDP